MVLLLSPAATDIIVFMCLQKVNIPHFALTKAGITLLTPLKILNEVQLEPDESISSPICSFLEKEYWCQEKGIPSSVCTQKNIQTDEGVRCLYTQILFGFFFSLWFIYLLFLCSFSPSILSLFLPIRLSYSASPPHACIFHLFNISFCPSFYSLTDPYINLPIYPNTHPFV